MQKVNGAAPAVRADAPAPALFNAVAERAPSFHSFLRWSWFEAAVTGELDALVVTREDRTPIAAVPRERRRLGPFGLASIPGCYWPFRSFPIAADVDAGELAVVLRQSDVRRFLGPVWRLGPIFDNDPTAERLLAAAEAGGWHVFRRSLGTAFEVDFGSLRAAGPWPRTSTAQKNRWRERRLGDLGPVRYHSASGTSWTQADRDAVAAIEAGSWVAERNGDTKFHDPLRRRLWEAAAADPEIASRMSVSLMFVGDVPAAFTFCLEAGQVRHCIANGYDQRFAKHGPGKVLLYRDFADAADRGISRIGWGSGDTGYKSELGAEPGAEIIDLLFVRPRLLALPLKRLWERGSA